MSKKVWILKAFFVQKVRDIAELILPVDLRTKKRKVYRHENGMG
jgi:hypothetical protein